MPRFQIDHVIEARFGPQHIGQSVGKAGASGGNAFHSRVQPGDFLFDFDQQRIELHHAWIPQGNETSAWAQYSLELRAGLVEEGPMKRRGHADQMEGTRWQTGLLRSARAPDDVVLLRCERAIAAHLIAGLYA